jgi:hypothetical protein
MATALGVLAFAGVLCTQISQLFFFLLVHLLEIYTCSSNTQIYSTLGGTAQEPCWLQLLHDTTCHGTHRRVAFAQYFAITAETVETEAEPAEVLELVYFQK